MGGGRYEKLGVNEGQGNWAGVATSFRHTWAQTCRAARLSCTNPLIRG